MGMLVRPVMAVVDPMRTIAPMQGLLWSLLTAMMTPGSRL